MADKLNNGLQFSVHERKKFNGPEGEILVQLFVTKEVVATIINNIKENTITKSRWDIT